MAREDELGRLRRAAEQSPDDADASALYEGALLRAGQTDVVKERFRFEFLCPLKWEDLDQENRPAWSKERFCNTCEKAVHWVETLEELLQRSAAGECVAVPAKKIEMTLNDLVSEASKGAPAGKPSCLVPGDRPMSSPPPTKMGKIRRPE